MSLMEDLVVFFNKTASETESISPEGICPLCWGHQKYDHQIRTLYKDKQIDVENHQAKYTLIRDFMVNQLDGIRLKKEDENIYECPTCG